MKIAVPAEGADLEAEVAPRLGASRYLVIVELDSMAFDSMVGPVYYGGEAFVGTNCLLMWPVAIWEVVGKREYELLEYYTPEEAESMEVTV